MTELLAQKYQKKSDKQHVLDNPDTYTGTMETTEYDTYIFNDETNTIIHKNLTIIPGLYKLFDEGIVNCRDHYVRMVQSQQKPNSHQVSNIEITISDDGTITMFNDGNGIDVEKHPEHQIWIPEMIFGHLRTSTNYDKDEKKIVGGKNGFGFKLVLIWSTWGKIETVDHIRGLKYTQEFNDNLDKIHTPIIKKCKTKPYTRVEFKPDYNRLKLQGLSQDMISLFKRRVYDIAAITDKNVKVKYNGELVPVRNFQQYVDLYIGDKKEIKRCYEEANQRWEYAVCISPKDEFAQVSFVNGIFTGKGGKHVDYILNQITRKLTTYIKSKKKIDVKSSSIKEQLMLFIRCDIENPAFDSQTKDFMTTPASKFGSACEVSDKFVEKIAKMGVMEAACALTEIKETKIAKKSDGIKTKSIRGIPKLIDANYAGTNKSSECTVIFCEGDSAKAGIVSGLSKEDRNFIGVYPMRGKLFNVRGETPKKIGENKEICEIKQILGLEIGKKYTEESVKEKLRYGRVLFMTDQDLDGSHIKGLGINLFDSEWESLLSIPNFIGFMNTPILKARKGTHELVFYNDGEYKQWKIENDIKGWKIKYYKGLGTSTSKEFKEYFEKKKMVTFTSTGTKSKDSIDMVFNKKRASDRKQWLENYDRELFLDTNKEEILYEDFISKEMIHFSKYDCERSIPNMMDGLKTSQRKILYSAFKRNLTAEIKVAQFSGYVSEHSSYHHGEQSLNGAIVAMAQDFVGSNNINLLEPKGQFGTRLQGGSDSASERYIYTNLNKLTRLIYKEDDELVLDYLDDDGQTIEPVYYAPIIPMVLVNGCKGIGTGFSTEVLSYNPLTIIEYLKCKLNDTQTQHIVFEPYFEGFKGSIKKIDDNKYLIKGCYNIVGQNQIRVTELPVGTWTDDYKQYLESLLESENKKSSKTTGKKKSADESDSYIKDYVDMSTDKIVDILITFKTGSLDRLFADKLEYDCNAMEKLLKLYTTRTTTNMHLFDENEKLYKFNSPSEIIDKYMTVRREIYVKRKRVLLNKLRKEAKILENKVRFINENLNDTIDLRKKTKQQVVELLQNRNYDTVDEDTDFKYLVKMPMDIVTEENVLALTRERNKKIEEVNNLEKTTEEMIWIHELEELLKSYLNYSNIRKEQLTETSKTKPNKIKKLKIKN
jgi:DNA topoisomerase II